MAAHALRRLRRGEARHRALDLVHHHGGGANGYSRGAGEVADVVPDWVAAARGRCQAQGLRTRRWNWKPVWSSRDRFHGPSADGVGRLQRILCNCGDRDFILITSRVRAECQAASGILADSSLGGVTGAVRRQSSQARMRQAVIDTVEMKHQGQNTFSTTHSPYLRRSVKRKAGTTRASSACSCAGRRRAAAGGSPAPRPAARHRTRRR